MKKIILLILCFISFIHTVNAQRCWARSTKNGAGENNALALDRFNNVYFTGFFWYTDIIFEDDTLTNVNGDRDLFLAKYNSSGNMEWVKNPGDGHGEGYGATTDIFDNVYITGHFRTQMIMGNDTLNPLSGYDVFLAKYDTSGNVLWARTSTGNCGSSGQSVCTDLNGNVYVAGIFEWGDSLTFDSITLTNHGNRDIFLVKYNSSGTVLWAKSYGGSWLDECSVVKTDQQGNVYIAGGFSSDTIAFDTYTFINDGLYGPHSYLCKYDSTGNILWAINTPRSSIQDMNIDDEENITILGNYYYSAITFGNITLTGASQSNTEIFLVKYDSDANAIWAKTMGAYNYSYDNDYGWSLGTDSIGNIYISGSFSNQFTIGSNVLQYPSGLHEPIFIAIFNTDGVVLYTEVLKSGGDDQYQIAVTPSGTLFIASDFYNVNPFIVAEDTLWSAGVGEVIYVAKLDCIDISSGLEEIQSNNLLTLYPNPATNTLTINTDLNLKNGQLKIINTLGQEAYQLSIINYPLSIDISHLSPGIYFLSLTNGTEIVSKKFVKE